jgi:hypothetical protein
LPLGFKLTPELLEMGLTRLGVFAGQFKNLDADAKKAFIRFVMTAAESGDANHYLKTRLAFIEKHDDEIDRPPPVEVKSRVIDERGRR